MIDVRAIMEQTRLTNPWNNDNFNDTIGHSLETVISFGNGGICDYPYSENWAKSVVSCEDRWYQAVPWGVAVRECGFSDSNRDLTYEQTIHVSRKYQLPSFGDGLPLYRTEEVSKVMRVV